MDDPVIARADGSALYNFAVAVDDLDAGITHVVRGEDHLSNTPKQLLVFEALGVPRAAVRAPAAAPRSRRPQAVKAPRRGVGPGAARGRVPARGGRQLHRAARRRVRRRRGALQPAGAGRALPARAGLEESRGVRRAQAPPHERPLAARARHRRADSADSSSTPGGPACGRPSRSPRRRSRRWPSSGRWCRSCSTARRTMQRRSTASIAGDGGVEVLRGARAALAEAEPFTRRDDRDGAAPRRREPRRETREGVPARPGRDRRDHRVSGHLRERRAARSRGDAGPDRSGARSEPVVQIEQLNRHRTSADNRDMDWQANNAPSSPPVSEPTTRMSLRGTPGCCEHVTN